MNELFLCVACVVSVAIITAGFLLAQKKHYEFIASQIQFKDLDALSDKILVRLQEFDDYKKKVDSLVVRAGFKL